MKDSQIIPFPDRRQEPRRRRARPARPSALQVANLLRALGLTESDLPALRDLFATLRELGLPPHQAATMVKVAAGRARWPLLEQELVYFRHLGISLDDEGEAEARMLLQLAREVRRRRWSVPEFVEWATRQLAATGAVLPRDFRDEHEPLPGALETEFRWERDD
ncbi:MAG: hypothetical protein AB1609_18195 [Bacillota bacterium]